MKRYKLCEVLSRVGVFLWLLMESLNGLYEILFGTPHLKELIISKLLFFAVPLAAFSVLFKNPSVTQKLIECTFIGGFIVLVIQTMANWIISDILPFHSLWPCVAGGWSIAYILHQKSKTRKN